MGRFGKAAGGWIREGASMSLAVNRDADPHYPNVPLDLLRCPVTGSELYRKDSELVAIESDRHYRLDLHGIPPFAEEFCSEDARIQQAHYEIIAEAYAANLGYPHTKAYMAYLDEALLKEIDPLRLGTVAELCRGHGEAFRLLARRVGRGIGVDVSVAMLCKAVTASRRHFVVRSGGCDDAATGNG